MSERSPKRSFAARPADPESWIKAPDRHAASGQAAAPRPRAKNTKKN